MTGSMQRTSIALLALATAFVLTAPAVGAAAATAPATAPDTPAYVPWQTAANSTFAFTRFDGEYSLSTGKVFFLGGRLADATTDGSIWSFDPETGVYADTLVDMPVPVSNYEIARLFDATGDEVFVLFGGRSGATGTVTNTVQGYYPESNTTTTFASDPYPVATSPGAVAVVRNRAYSFGGFDAAAVIASTYIFDITAAEGSRWTTGPSLALARSYMGEAVVDGVIYAIGGDTWDGAALIAQTIVEKLDTNAAVLAWDDAGVADLPIPCDEMRAFGFNAVSPYDLANAVVVAGCGQWSTELPNSMIYDVAANTWDDASFPDLNQVRRNHAGALVPWGAGSLGRPGMWIWGGRQGSDATLLQIPEFYPFTSAVIFIDGFEVGSTGAWSSTLP